MMRKTDSLLELLLENGITLQRYEPGINYTSTCPQCSHTRKKRGAKCLSIRIDADGEGATWYCNHCEWSDGVRTHHNKSYSARSISNVRLESTKVSKIETPQRFFDDIRDVAQAFGYHSIHQGSDNFEERAGFIQASGITSEDAERFASMQASVWDAITVEQLNRLRTLHPFGARMIELTRPTILADFYVGFTGPYSLFWYVDIQGRFVNCKQIRFSEDAFHKMDDSNSPRFLYSKARHGAGQCLFGEQQLARAPVDRPIMLVESEKSSIIGSHHRPEYIWLATGGATKLTASTAEVLLNRNVYILFDCDEDRTKIENQALSAAQVIGNAGAHQVTILDQYATFPGHTNDGWDFADEIFKEWRQEHEHIYR
jgi:hypothetical protein